MSASDAKNRDVVDPDEVIREVALQNGQGLLRDDPVMMLVTIMNCVAKAYDEHNEGLVVKYAGLLTEYRQFHQEAALQWRNDARDYANTALNAALDAARDNAAAVMSEGAARIHAMIGDSLGRQMAACLADQKKEFRKLEKYLAWMAAATGAALLAAALLALIG
ncbi:MAG: hypothetical protein LBU23_02500 [Planctomycetota bacterium]|jgi:hypothetical protein|nr:hypothetical protein [Planctomycetota bacterium]